MIKLAGAPTPRRAVLGLLVGSVGGLAVGRWARHDDVAVALSARDLLVSGTYRPDLSTAGVIPGSKLRITQNHVPRSGTTYTDLDVRHVVVPGPGVGNVTYRNCIFRGSKDVPNGFSSLYTMFGPHRRGFTFIDCTFRPQQSDFHWVGLQGYGFTLRRCDASDLVDQVEVFNTNDGPGGAGDDSLRDGPCDVVIEQCYFHDSAYWPPGVDTSVDGSHSDDVQWEGGSGLVVRGNYFTGRLDPRYTPNVVGGDTANSAMLIKPDVGNIGGALITANWFGGGSVTINIADSPRTGRYIEDVGQIGNNHFYQDQFYAPTAIIVGVRRAPQHDDIAVDATGNAFIGSGAPVPVVRRFS